MTESRGDMGAAVTIEPGRPPAASLGFVEAWLPTGPAEALAGLPELAKHVDVSEPALGHTWAALATIAARDLGVARVVEPHLDALSILDQGGHRDAAVEERTWGVFAAEGGDNPLVAIPSPGGWTLRGVKPWCSLAGFVDSALVTAHLGDGNRGLFAVELRDPRVEVIAGAWHARGLAEIESGPVRFSDVDARAIGDPGWYLSRPGFAWGGISVAACWFGGSVGIARTVFAALAAADSPGPLQLMHLGAIDELVESSRRALAEAAAIARGTVTTVPGTLLTKRVRATVARASEEIILRAGHALGPAPLALDEEHAKRVADLQLYIRQHHAERDQASAGSQLLGGVAPW